MINGRTKATKGNKNKNALVIMTHSMSNILPKTHQFTTVEPSLQPIPDVDEFLKLETIAIIPPEKTKNNDELMEHFNNTVIQENGRLKQRYLGEMKISINQKIMNYAMGDLNHCTKKLWQFLTCFVNMMIIKVQHENGTIKIVYEKSEEGEIKHYILYHAVFTPEKNTTKARIM